MPGLVSLLTLGWKAENDIFSEVTEQWSPRVVNVGQNWTIFDNFLCHMSDVSVKIEPTSPDLYCQISEESENYKIILSYYCPVQPVISTFKTWIISLWYQFLTPVPPWWDRALRKIFNDDCKDGEVCGEVVYLAFRTHPLNTFKVFCE